MQLSQMQDLGGCRAVVNSIEQVEELVAAYKNRKLKAANQYRIFDYITNPKQSGYRSVHLVYRYNSKHEQRARYNGLRIEIQIRSALQHSWATAVEVIDTITHQTLKSDIGGADWKRFFALMGSVFALEEGRPPVPGTPILREELFSEVRQLCVELDVVGFLDGLMTGFDVIGVVEPSEVYILKFDRVGKSTTVLGFNDNREASSAYVELEREAIDNANIQVVLVAVDSVSALKKAYPNYYFDTLAFLAYVKGLVSN